MITGVQLVENILKLAGPLPQKKLQKLAYLAEIEYIKCNGERLSDLSFKKYYYGPFSIDIRNIEDEDENIFVKNGSDDVYTTMESNLLNPEMVESIDEKFAKHLEDVVKNFGSKTGKELEEIADQTEPFLETENHNDPILLDDFAWFYKEISSEELWKKVEEKDKENKENGVYGKVII